MKKKVLITGASGAVGFEAFMELLRRNDRYLPRVLALDTPRERRVFQPYSDQAEFAWGDLRNPEDVERAVTGTDVVLHVGAIIPPVADHHPEYHQHEDDSTEVLDLERESFALGVVQRQIQAVSQTEDGIDREVQIGFLQTHSRKQVREPVFESADSGKIVRVGDQVHVGIG